MKDVNLYLLEDVIFIGLYDCYVNLVFIWITTKILYYRKTSVDFLRLRAKDSIA